MHTPKSSLCLFILFFTIFLPSCSSQTHEDDQSALNYLSQKYDIHVSVEKPKVILDTDMTFLGDDAFCLSLLVQADSIGLIDLTGVTITGGNSFVSVGTNAALRQLELWGRSDIPVYIGTDEPLNGFRNLEEQSQIVGSIDNYGAMVNLDDYVAPDSFHDLGKYYERKWGYSQTAPEEDSAVEFLLNTVADNKTKVTIISVGSPISIALACRQDADFAKNVNEIIYLGGILGEKGTTQISSFWVDNQGGLYRRNTNRKDSCADAIAAAAYLSPSVVIEYQDFLVDIDDDTASAEYGKLIQKTLSYDS